MGHRNPQGLYFDKENNFILETEHGPKGGDEINLNHSPFDKVITTNTLDQSIHKNTIERFNCQSKSYSQYTQ